MVTRYTAAVSGELAISDFHRHAGIDRRYDRIRSSRIG